jgi:act minimal PKS acyl carrier protein
MSEFTVDDLRRIMRSTVGVGDGVDLNGDILDTPFTELGYDSLALLEITGEVQREYAVTIPDEDVADLETPRQAVECVNRRAS